MYLPIELSLNNYNTEENYFLKEMLDECKYCHRFCLVLHSKNMVNASYLLNQWKKMLHNVNNGI